MKIIVSYFIVTIIFIISFHFWNDIEIKMKETTDKSNYYYYLKHFDYFEGTFQTIKKNKKEKGVIFFYQFSQLYDDDNKIVLNTTINLTGNRNIKYYSLCLHNKNENDIYTELNCSLIKKTRNEKDFDVLNSLTNDYINNDTNHLYLNKKVKQMNIIFDSNFVIGFKGNITDNEKNENTYFEGKGYTFSNDILKLTMKFYFYSIMCGIFGWIYILRHLLHSRRLFSYKYFAMLKFSLLRANLYL